MKITSNTILAKTRRRYLDIAARVREGAKAVVFIIQAQQAKEIQRNRETERDRQVGRGANASIDIRAFLYFSFAANPRHMTARYTSYLPLSSSRTLNNETYRICMYVYIYVSNIYRCVLQRKEKQGTIEFGSFNSITSALCCTTARRVVIFRQKRDIYRLPFANFRHIESTDLAFLIQREFQFFFSQNSSISFLLIFFFVSFQFIYLFIFCKYRDNVENLS